MANIEFPNVGVSAYTIQHGKAGQPRFNGTITFAPADREEDGELFSWWSRLAELGTRKPTVDMVPFDGLLAGDTLGWNAKFTSVTRSGRNFSIGVGFWRDGETTVPPFSIRKGDMFSIEARIPTTAQELEHFFFAANDVDSPGGPATEAAPHVVHVLVDYDLLSTTTQLPIPFVGRLQMHSTTKGLVDDPGGAHDVSLVHYFCKDVSLSQPNGHFYVSSTGLVKDPVPDPIVATYDRDAGLGSLSGGFDMVRKITFSVHGRSAPITGRNASQQLQLRIARSIEIETSSLTYVGGVDAVDNFATHGFTPKIFIALQEHIPVLPPFSSFPTVAGIALGASRANGGTITKSGDIYTIASPGSWFGPLSQYILGNAQSGLLVRGNAQELVSLTSAAPTQEHGWLMFSQDFRDRSNILQRTGWHYAGLTSSLIGESLTTGGIFEAEFINLDQAELIGGIGVINELNLDWKSTATLPS